MFQNCRELPHVGSSCWNFKPAIEYNGVPSCSLCRPITTATSFKSSARVSAFNYTYSPAFRARVYIQSFRLFVAEAALVVRRFGLALKSYLLELTRRCRNDNSMIARWDRNFYQESFKNLDWMLRAIHAQRFLSALTPRRDNSSASISDKLLILNTHILTKIKKMSALKRHKYTKITYRAVSIGALVKCV